MKRDRPGLGGVSCLDSPWTRTPGTPSPPDRIDDRCFWSGLLTKRRLRGVVEHRHCEGGISLCPARHRISWRMSRAQHGPKRWGIEPNAAAMSQAR